MHCSLFNGLIVHGVATCRRKRESKRTSLASEAGELAEPSSR